MIGIYKLYWEQNPFYYIGQSIKIELRIKGHIHQLKRGQHPSARLQDIFNEYGAPKLCVLQQCKQSELDHYEREHTLNDFVEEYCCNTANTVPMRKVAIDITKEQYQKLSDLAKQSKTGSVVGYVKYMVERELME